MENMIINQSGMSLGEMYDEIRKKYNSNKILLALLELCTWYDSLTNMEL